MKTACVMSGGGAKGSFQVGVLKQLIRSGVEINSYYGTSVGAINAGVISYCGMFMLETFWRDIKGKSDILSLNTFSLLWSPGMHSMDPLKKKLEQHVKGTTPIEAVTCSVSLETGKIRYVSNQSSSLELFRESILASACIPFAMEPVNGFVDGGVREITPLKKAIQDGADNIIVILCDPYAKDPAGEAAHWQIPTGFLSAVKIGYRCIDGIMEHEIFANDLEKCMSMNKKKGKRKVTVTLYAPDEHFMDTLEFDSEKIALAIAAGTLAKPVPL
jgi:predicted acylesterase/phospholipase RssA